MSWSQTKKDLTAAVAGFDHYYMMSDDHRVWQRGEKQKEELNRLFKEYATEDANDAMRWYIAAHFHWYFRNSGDSADVFIRSIMDRWARIVQ